MEKATPYNPNNLIEQPLNHYSALFRAGDPAEMAERTGVPFADGRFTLTVLGEKKIITWPDFADENWRDRDRVLFMRHLLEGQRCGDHSGFLTYAQMPWGDVYDRQFHNRCVNRLAGTYGSRIAAFEHACLALGGQPLAGSGTGFELPFMPGLLLRFIVWEGDEEFPAAAQILFSDNFPRAFSAEDRVILCEYTLGKLRLFEK